MLRKRYLMILIALVVATSPILTQTINAASTNTGVVSFSVKAVIPENQINSNSTYFDLKMKPGQKQDLKVMIFNNSNEELQVKMAVNAASTGNSGLIDYSGTNTSDETLKYPMTNIATLENQQITIPASSSKEATVTLQMPADYYDGVILGGIVITGINNKTTQEASQGLSLENEYSYVIGLKLTETDVSVRPNLNLKSIEPSLVNYRTALVAKIQNSQAAIIKGMSVSGSVYKDKETTVFQSASQDIVDMAPNSTYSFPIDWKNQRIDPGKYRLHLIAVHEDKTWEWDEEFTVGNDTANSVNQDAVYLGKKYPIWLYVSIGVTILIICMLTAFLIGRRRRKED